MNRQNPGIEWTDFTYNPVTGCRFGCKYGPRGCYANEIAQRIYPEKFEPTFRPERLHDKDLGRIPEGSKIFVCDMGDLFGSWIPDEWIKAVLEVVKAYPQYIYQFLTKNPTRYLDWINDFTPNCWLGTTIDHEDYYLERSKPFWRLPENIIGYVSFEPMLSSMPIDSAFKWIIIGERTGKWANKDELSKVARWASDIPKQAKELNIPIFFKNKLKEIYPYQEFPLGVNKYGK